MAKNKYLDLLGGEADHGAEVEKAKENPYHELVASRASPLLAVASRWGMVQDTERAARILRAQQATQLPTALIDRNLDDIELETRRADFNPEAFRKASPAVADWLAEQPEHYAIAQDDLPRLAQLEAVIREGGRYKFGQGGRVEVPIGDGSQAEVFDSSAAFYREYRSRQFFQGMDTQAREQRAKDLRSAYGPLANVAAGAYQAWTSTLEAVQVGPSDPSKFQPARDVAQASVDLSPGIGGGIQRGIGGILADLPLMLTGGPLAKGVTSLAHLGKARTILTPLVQTAAAVQPLALRSGILEAKEHGIWNGLAAWGIETVVPAAFGKTGIERAIIGKLTPEASAGLVQASKRLLTDSGLEAGEEAATELAHALHEVWSGTNPNALDSDQLVPRLVTSGAVGGIAGAGFNLPGVVASLQADDQRTGGDLGGEVVRARAGRAWLEALGHAVTGSKTLERHPEGLQAIVDRLVAQGAPDAVHIAPERWATFWQEQGRDPEQVAGEVLGDREAFQEAIATGAPLSIPLAAYVSKIAGTPAHAGLVDDLALAPAAMTARQAEERAKAMTTPAQADQVAAEAQAAVAAPADPGEASAARVHDDLVEQLTAAGLDAPAAEANAQVVAAGFRTLAQRFNRGAAEGAAPVDPFALYEGYRLRVQRDIPEALRARERTDVLDTLLDRLRTGEVPTEGEVRGQSLTEYLREQGGLTDAQFVGELRGVDESDQRKPGRRSLVQPVGGNPLDQAREMAVAAGFLEEGASINDLLEAIDAEQRGRASYRPGAEDATQGGIREALLSLRDELARRGVDVAAVDNATARKVLDDIAPAAPEQAREAAQEFDQGAAPRPLSPEAQAFVDALPAGAREALASDIIYRTTKAPTDAAGDMGNLQMALTIAQARGRVLNQQAKNRIRRGSIKIGADRAMSITLFRDADLSTFLHEAGHFWLEVLGDLAARPDAPAEVVNDYQAVLDWLEVKERTAIGEDQHEQFARGFEAYLMEGKAPSAGLRQAFSKFRAWLVAIYRRITSLRVQLNPEVRGVFDRLLASEDEIAQAQGRLDAAPVFKDADEAGMTSEEFVRYRATVDAAVAEAEDDLRVQLMREFRREQGERWAAEQRTVRGEVADRINAMPVYQAISALQDGTLPDGTRLPDDLQGLKLDRAELVALYGEASLDRLPGPGKGRKNPNNRGRHIYTTEGGIALQRAADLFGFRTGDSLWEALVNAFDRQQVIEAETEVEMRQRHPDPMTDGTIADKAMAAVHGDKRADLLVLELNALGKRTGQRPAPVEVLREAARDAVARTAIKDLRPDRYLSAERRAAREALAAAAKGDRAGAFTAKQRELLNHELYRAATTARETVDKAHRYLVGMLEKPARERIGKAGGWEWTVTKPDRSTLVVGSEEEARAAVAIAPGSTWARTSSYLDQIIGILARYELAPVSVARLGKRQALADWIAQQEEQGAAVEIPDQVRDEARRLNWRQASVEELLGVCDAVRNVETLARLKNRLSALQRERDLQEAVGKAVEVIEANGTKRANRVDVPGALDSAVDLMSGVFAMHRKLASLTRQMDGGTDGGVVWDLVMRPINAAADREAVLRGDASEALAVLFKAHRKAGGGKLDQRVRVPGVGEALSLEARLSVALNWGNEANRDRLRTGHGWDDSTVQQVLATLSDADWSLVEGIWRHVDSYWSEIAAKEQRVTGVAPEKVEASPFRLPSGRVVRGGYYPIKYDPAYSAAPMRQDAAEQAKEAMRGSIARASTRRGHTKARAGAQAGARLRLDLGVLPSHLNQVVHDLTHHELLIDLNRILRHPAMAKAVVDHYGPQVMRQLDSAVADVAAGDVGAQDAFEKGMTWIRSGASVAVMGWNLMSAAQQITGFSQSIVRVGPAYMGRALGRMFRDARHLEATGTWVDAKSSMMRLRGKTLLREVNEALNVARPGGWRQDAAQTFYYLMGRMQRMVDVPTWVAAYEKAMEGVAGGDEVQAIAIADQTVIDTQGAGQIKDLSAIQRKGPFWKLWTVFYSYFNVTMNLTSESFARTSIRNPLSIAKLAADLLLLWTFPVVATYAIKAVLRGGGEDDPEKLAKKLAWDHLSYAAGMLVGVRDVANVVEMGTGYDGPAGARGFAELGKLVRQVGEGDADRGLARSAVTTAGIFLHLPTTQLLRLYDGYVYAQQNHTGPLPVLFGPPPRNTGR